MTTKKFHIGDILSITTGKLVSPEGVGGIYKILNYLTGDNLYTHQLPRAADECRPWLKAQFPQLNDVDASDVNPDNHKRWIEEQVEKYGEYLEVKPLPALIHDIIDPLDELKRMVPEDKIVVVQKND